MLNNEQRRLESYRNARKLGATSKGAWFDYNELVSRGLVETVQDGGLAIVSYPIAKRRGLAIDSYDVACQLRKIRYQKTQLKEYQY